MRQGLCLLLGLLLGAATAQAQAPLTRVNDSTTVRDIDFKFVDSQTFEVDRLKGQIATKEPGFIYKVKDFLPFVNPAPIFFEPVVLQQDVVRLRRFYRDNGFLKPQIDYPASQFNLGSNSIRVIFTIREGPPLIIQDVGFFGPDGRYALNQFEGQMREDWIEFRDDNSFKIGDRYTDYELLRIEDAVLTWLQNRGFAFVQVNTETNIDTTYNTVDIRFDVDAGPQGYVSEILVEGNERVGKEVVQRELPFDIGDRFSYRKLIQGQRELFALNLFRVALADVPPACETLEEEDTAFPLDSLQATSQADSPRTMVRVDAQRANLGGEAETRCQPRDADVTVRYRVREAKLRYLTAQTGYGRELGLTLQGDWTHRNFLGDARRLTVSAVAYTGVLGNPGGNLEPPFLLEGSVTLHQPYLFTTRLSGFVKPFIRFERDPLLDAVDPVGPAFMDFLDLNRREMGVSTQLVYELLPFRTLSMEYTFSRVVQAQSDTLDIQPTDPPSIPGEDLFLTDPYSKSIIRLNGTFGDVDDFLNPRRGFLVRPFMEEAGTLIPESISTIEYFKTGAEVVGYLPFSGRSNIGGRLFAGRIWPRDESRAQFVVPYEDRFDPIRFYSGGASDVRGWNLSLLGPRANRTTFVFDEETGGIVIDEETGLPQTRNEQYEAVGGLAKVAGNVEVRLPFPGLGSAWRSAVFLDFGQVSARRIARNPLVEQARRFEDEGKLSLRPGAFRFGTGAGIRYETPIGYLRLDLAFKLNPERLDLLKPREAFLESISGLSAQEKANLGLPEDFSYSADPRFLRRFALHLSIGQAF